MSAQNRPDGLEPNLRREIRAHAKAERQRVRSLLRPGVVPDVDLDDPGVAYRTPHHRWHTSQPAHTRVARWKVRRQQLRRQARAQRRDM